MDKERIQSIDNRCKWRGKRINDRKWIYGSLIDCGSEYHIIEKGENLAYFGINRWNLVCYPTVGQYTGLKDKNNEDIYEGDILRSENGRLFVIVYDIEKKKFMLTNAGGNLTFSVYEDDALSLEIVGNIYDNKELLTNK